MRRLDNILMPLEIGVGSPTIFKSCPRSFWSCTLRYQRIDASTFFPADRDFSFESLGLGFRDMSSALFSDTSKNEVV